MSSSTSPRVLSMGRFALLLTLVLSLCSRTSSQTLPLCSSAVPPSMGSVAVGVAEYFVSPGNEYAYMPPVTVLQPWSWTGVYLGGTCSESQCPFAPNGPNSQPPVGSTFAFMQPDHNGGNLTSAVMNATLQGMTVGSVYNLSFYYATRYGALGDDSLQVMVGEVLVWSSQASIIDNTTSGWLFASATFTATQPCADFAFVAASNSSSGYIDIADVLVQTAGYTASAVYLSASTGANWEYPNLDGASYGQYITLPLWLWNPPVTALQPWTWTYMQGGVAIMGSPFSPPPPSTPPSGGPQFAVIETSPNGALNAQQSNMSCMLSGLTSYTAYGLSFYMATPGNGGNVTQSQLIVTVNGQTVFTSVANIVDAGGWQQLFSSSFTPTTTNPVPLIFTVTSTSNIDHSILIDDLVIGPYTSVLASGAPAPYSSLCSSAVPPPMGSVAVGVAEYFVSPGNEYAYMPPVTVLQPWSWTGVYLGGTCSESQCPFAPNGPNSQPPVGSTFAFMQPDHNGGNLTSAVMNATLQGMTVGSVYNLSFYYATRYGALGDDSLQVMVGEVLVWSSQASIIDNTTSGWLFASATFTATQPCADFAFVAASNSSSGYIDIADVLVQTAGYTASAVYLSASTGANWEYPNLDGASYGQYITLPLWLWNPPVTASQPWTWTYMQGGVAIMGSPFSPPPPSTPPSGGPQFAVIETSPNGALNAQQSNMSCMLSGLTSYTAYGLSFYMATPGNGGNVTQSQLIVTVNGQTVFTSVANIVDAGGWQQLFSSSFTPTTTNPVPLIFTVTSTSNIDHSILIDDLVIAPYSGIAPAQGSLCYLTYALPGSVDYPWSVSLSLTFTYNPTPVNVSGGVAYTVLSGSGTRVFTNRLGNSFTTAVTVLSGVTDNLLFTSSSLGTAFDGSGLTLSVASPVQLPGGSPMTLTSTINLVGSAGAVMEVGAYRVDGLGQLIFANVPGFVNTSIGASNINSLAVTAGVCAAPLTFTNGLRAPTQPSASNGAALFYWSYTISDGVTYQVQTNLTVTANSAFATIVDQLGNTYQNLTSVSGTRVYTYLITGQTLTSTVTGLASTAGQLATQRWYPYVLLASSPGVYTPNTAPYVDAGGLMFTVSPAVPENGVPTTATPTTSTIRVFTQNSNVASTILTEQSYYTAPLINLQQQQYTL